LQAVMKEKTDLIGRCLNPAISLLRLIFNPVETAL